MQGLQKSEFPVCLVNIHLQGIKNTFSVTEPIAMQCSWCKVAYHSTDCFKSEPLSKEKCDLGLHSTLIVPPHCIIKLQDRVGKGFDSSVRRTSSAKPNSQAPEATANASNDKDKDTLPVANLSKNSFAEKTPFMAVSAQNKESKPLIVFLNPKSGGNQGKMLFKKFQFLLNPRQVFDLTCGGPEFGLQMFKNVRNLHILACGGDGTAGWVMATIDKLKMETPPPIAVLPLGTGNDLARVLNWGPVSARFPSCQPFCLVLFCCIFIHFVQQFKLSGYTNDPLSKILLAIVNGTQTSLDR
ncbi:hypothetical protein Ciccas_009509 [Cichlidogyrus casuarinus]|uniref:DAGKc domain-containing protein n=1 Tax=Cichlidogyrus casuarinus TaxID=1844966 RepID=A0ABD2PZK4_9PLAT